MSVKIIIGYLRLLSRVIPHDQLTHLINDPKTMSLWRPFAETLDQDSAQIFDLETYIRLLRQLQPQFKRPISLILAERASLQDLGIMGYLASTSLDLKQALTLLDQYHSLIFEQTNLDSLKISQKQHLIQITLGTIYQNYREIYELNLALIFQIAKLIAKDQLAPLQRIELGLDPNFDLYHYEQFFGCEVRLSKVCYSISFDRQILEIKSLSSDQQLNQVLSIQAKAFLQQSDNFLHRQKLLQQKVLTLIEQGLKQQDEVVQAYVARQMNCSERTLQRQLKAYQLNFQTILDEYRLDLSQNYLRQGRTFTEIAQHLGYADQSAFGRAFKRWTGITPKAYIKLNLIP